MIGGVNVQKAVHDKVDSTQGIDSALPGTVLGDLKLTEHLSNELEEVRGKFDSLNEALEKASLERDAYKKKYSVLHNKYLNMKKLMGSQRFQLERQTKINMGLELKMNQKMVESEQLSKITVVSEQMRKNFCNELKNHQVTNESLQNQHFNLNMEQKIANHSMQFLQEQFTILHTAVENIRTDKQYGDKLTYHIEQLTKAADGQSETIQDIRD